MALFTCLSYLTKFLIKIVDKHSLIRQDTFCIQMQISFKKSFVQFCINHFDEAVRKNPPSWSIEEGKKKLFGLKNSIVLQRHIYNKLHKEGRCLENILFNEIIQINKFDYSKQPQVSKVFSINFLKRLYQLFSFFLPLLTMIISQP